MWLSVLNVASVIPLAASSDSRSATNEHEARLPQILLVCRRGAGDGGDVQELLNLEIELSERASSLSSASLGLAAASDRSSRPYAPLRIRHQRSLPRRSLKEVTAAKGPLSRWRSPCARSWRSTDGSLDRARTAISVASSSANAKTLGSLMVIEGTVFRDGLVDRAARDLPLATRNHATIGAARCAPCPSE